MQAAALFSLFDWLVRARHLPLCINLCTYVCKLELPVQFQNDFQDPVHRLFPACGT